MITFYLNVKIKDMLFYFNFTTQLNMISKVLQQCLSQDGGGINPSAKVTTTIVGKTLQSIILIPSSTPSDSGKYACEATYNGIGK